MEAKKVNGFVVLSEQEVEGDTILLTNCKDYDEYDALPPVVNYKGRYYGKTGWSSDSHLACFKRSARLALVK